MYKNLISGFYSSLMPEGSPVGTQHLLPAHSKKKLQKIVLENIKWIYGPQNDFFVQSLKSVESLQTPIFYALPKIHKVPWTWKTRPVVSTVSSVLSVASK
jgi:hypothetical protein